jgi:hypothetical protein
VMTTMRYSHSGHGFDCSLTESVSGLMPSVWLAREMGLSWAKRQFRFADSAGRIITFDPSHEEDTGPGALLIEQASLRQFLRSSGFAVLWLLIGEKMFLGEHSHDRDPHRPQVEVFRSAFILSEDQPEFVLRTVCPLGEPPEIY